MADASHELRTPVAALVTALEVSLRRPRDAETYRQTLESCLADAQVLQRLVEALLAHVRGELSAVHDAPETIDLEAMLNECVKALRPLADERSIRLRGEIVGGALPLIRSQPGRLRSIIMNLLSNAIEHNGEGTSVEVTCRSKVVAGPTAESDIGSTRAVPATASITLEVSDTGVGIPPEHVPHIFDSFYRIDSSRSSGHLGLGLFLVRSHVQALGGDYELHSEPGQGTLFRVTFCVPVETHSDRSLVQVTVAHPEAQSQSSLALSQEAPHPQPGPQLAGRIAS
jgi:signal transduction histidine kinase